MSLSTTKYSSQGRDLRFRIKSVEEKWNIFKDTYSEMVEKYVPNKFIKSGQKLDTPWTRSRTVKRAKRKRRKAWKMLRIGIYTQTSCIMKMLNSSIS